MKNEIAIQSQKKYLASINNPISADFKSNVLKMNMSNLVQLVLETKPQSIYKSYKDEEEKTVDIIMLMLIQFQDFYNCKNKMNKAQLQETAHYIIQNFRHFNYYDIGLCLKKVKMTYKVYDRIDGGMILEWLTHHDIERTGSIVNERERQRVQHQAEWSALGERTSELTTKDWLKK